MGKAIQVVWLALRMPQELEILGVFETEAEAAAVASTRRDVIGPLPLGVAFPDAPWEGAYYPMAVDGADQLDGAEV